MKRFILISFAALAALLAASCEKEVNTSASVAKVPATLSVNLDDVTKTALDEDGLSILWEGTESIGVFDGIAAAPNKFDATSAGATTSFTGEVSAGAENFIVFYPYQAESVVSDATNSTIKVRMPAVQQAVKNGFDPAAGLAARVVTSLSDPVKLYNQFSLLKVNVDQDGVTAITVSATNRKLAGGIALKVSTNGGSNGEAPTSNSVTLKNADDSALEQGFYYIAVRPSSTTSPYEGFAMEVVKNGVTKIRTASNNLVVARNHILSIGKVSTLFEEGGDEPSYEGRYDAYMAGEDIVIGSVTLNKATHGNATLLTANNAPTNISKSVFENGGVVFLRAEGTGSFVNPNNPTISTPLYMIADGDENVELSLDNVINLADGALYLKGLSLALSQVALGGDKPKTTIMNVNKNASGSMTELVMDNCFVNQNVASFVTTNSSFKAYGIQSVEIVNSSFAVSVDANIINVTKDYSGISVYSKFVFNNNYVYSTDGNNHRTSAFAYSGSTGDQMEVEMNHNLFYNTATTGNIKHNTLKKVTAQYNMVWTADASGLAANAKLFGMTTKTAIPTVSVSSNIGYGPLASGKRWTIADSTVDTGMEAIIVPDSDPIASADVTTGTFTMASGYTSYGPQL